jgi:HsdM N-terminal domain
VCAVEKRKSLHQPLVVAGVIRLTAFFPQRAEIIMFAENHQKLADKIWAVANKLRGPYRPPQYRKVMLPLIVLRRLDCLLEPTKDQVLKQVALACAQHSDVAALR